MKTFTFDLHAGPCERFAPAAFASIIGKTVPVRINLFDRPHTASGTVVDARIVDGGHVARVSVNLTSDFRRWGQ